ncbi:MAG: hypothetical protein L0Y54_23415 [Sporichthyaceae bacterium]|nr:hypothetical protein [Sporichthyaceae bacterium]
MGANERLRTALLTAGHTSRTLAEAVGVDPKTAERWVNQPDSAPVHRT